MWATDVLQSVLNLLDSLVVSEEWYVSDSPGKPLAWVSMSESVYMVPFLAAGGGSGGGLD